MRSLFPYIGGKNRVASKLIALFPKHRCFVEVFAGAANVLLAKDPSDAEVINDINSDLINLFRVIRWHPDELFKELVLITHSRKEYEDYHDQPGLTDVQRAARHWFKLKTSFGGTGSAGYRNFSFGTVKKSPLRLASPEVIMQAHERLDGVFIENDDFDNIINRYDRSHTFFFCDPPYWKGADYGVPFEWDDQVRLAESLRKIKGKFLLTINDHKDIRKLYKGFKKSKLPMHYTACKKHIDVNELIIANYPLPRQRKTKKKGK